MKRKELFYLPILLIMSTLIFMSFIDTQLNLFDSVDPSKNTLSGYKVMGKFGLNFSYFTYWTNIMIVIILWKELIFKKKSSGITMNSIATYSAITGFVWIALLSHSKEWGSSWDDFMSIYLHIITIAIILIWFFTSSKEQRKIDETFKQIVFKVMIIPVCYIFWGLTLYLVSNNKFAVYPFMNFANVFNAGLPNAVSIIIAIAMCVLVFGFFILTSYLFWRKQFVPTKNN